MYFYPRPPRGGRHGTLAGHYKPCEISIHALREEGDSGAKALRALRRISIHALREEGDQTYCRSGTTLKIFLSTPSARRATIRNCSANSSSRYFYPRPPRGGRLYTVDKLRDTVNFYPRPPRGGRRACTFRRDIIGLISIHALREEGDMHTSYLPDSPEVFLSTPSARRATLPVNASTLVSEYFYPRPPRGGRLLKIIGLLHHRYFYPRPPRGGRPSHKSTYSPFSTFLSTPSARRATASCPRSATSRSISIHALREEGDRFSLQAVMFGSNFYPRPPRGGRPL